MAHGLVRHRIHILVAWILWRTSPCAIEFHFSCVNISLFPGSARTTWLPSNRSQRPSPTRPMTQRPEPEHTRTHRTHITVYLLTWKPESPCNLLIAAKTLITIIE